MYTNYTTLNVVDEPIVELDMDALYFEYVVRDGCDGQTIASGMNARSILHTSVSPIGVQRIRAFMNAKDVIAERLEVTYAVYTSKNPECYDKYDTPIKLANVLVKDTYEMP